MHLTLGILVAVLGARHGLDADHLAFIDGETRHNLRIGSPFARWVGTLFSLGHGLVVAVVAYIIGAVASGFRFPGFFDVFAGVFSILSLGLIGTLNLVQLLRTGAGKADFAVRGWKGRLLPGMLRETSNPFAIPLAGALFALAADTVSQTSVWALAAAGEGRTALLLLGLLFLAGMMTVDTLDSQLVYLMVRRSDQIGRTAYRWTGWTIVGLAYGVGVYEATAYFLPDRQLHLEAVGMAAFALLIAGTAILRLCRRRPSGPPQAG